MMTDNNYGSVEHYKELFSDILCDVQACDPLYGDNIIKAFRLALVDLRNYHQEQVEELNRVEKLIDEQISL